MNQPYIAGEFLGVAQLSCIGWSIPPSERFAGPWEDKKPNLDCFGNTRPYYANYEWGERPETV